MDNLNVHRKNNHGISKPISRLEHEELVGKGEHPYCSLENKKVTEYWKVEKYNSRIRNKQ